MRSKETVKKPPKSVLYDKPDDQYQVTNSQPGFTQQRGSPAFALWSTTSCLA